MTSTPNLALPYIDAAQSQKHVTHNAALAELDAIVQLSVKQSGALAPPAAPNAGDRYLVGVGATGAFAGQDGAVAAFIDGAWIFAAPKSGWRCYVESAGELLIFANGAWADVGSSIHALQNLSGLGVGTSADATNAFAAKLNAALFTARSIAEGGAGDMRLTLNKSATANTLSLMFQDNYSGRAEAGLCADDHFHIKVSPDGAAWREAINIDPASGIVSFPSGASGATGPAGPSGATGPQGATGIPGAAGPAGARGNSILTYSGAPTNGADANGVAPIDGDYAIDTTDNRLYGPRAAGAWPSAYVSLSGGSAPTPPVPTSIVATGGAGGISVVVVAPSSSLFASAQIYRAAHGAAFSTAVFLGSLTGSSGATLGPYVDLVAAGAYDYYAVSASLSGAVSAPTGPSSASSRAYNFAYLGGDQRANIAMTASAGLFVGAPENLMNAANGTNTYFAGAALTGAQWMMWDFGSPKVVHELSLIESGGFTLGVWQAQGSNDAASWTNIGSPGPLGGTVVGVPGNPFAPLNANTANAWRYYRLMGLSGATNSSPWILCIEFSIGS